MRPRDVPQSLNPGDIVAGRYEVMALAGEGGMAQVYAARHLHLSEQYAIKVLRSELAQDKNIVSRFLQEARAAAQLRSDHTCRVFDVGLMPSGIPYIVMELLHGEDLGGHLVRTGRLPVEDAVEFVIQACEALAEAHSVGLVHRDIKPENLFVTTRPDGWRSIKLLDFGISKLVDPDTLASTVRRHLDTADLMGTPHYMAPEHIRSSNDAEARSDLWSLGVVLYELLSGQLPFDGATVPEVSASILETEPPSLDALRPDLPPGLVEAVHWCLSKPTELRVSSAAELAAQLVPFAPRRTRAVVERVQSLARSQGEHIQIPPSIMPPPLPPVTITSDPAPPPAESHLLRWGLVALFVFACAAGVTWMQSRKSTPTSATPTSASPTSASPTSASSTSMSTVSPAAAPAATTPARPTSTFAEKVANVALEPPPTPVSDSASKRSALVSHAPGPMATAAAKVESPPAAISTERPSWDKGPDLGF